MNAEGNINSINILSTNKTEIDNNKNKYLVILIH